MGNIKQRRRSSVPKPLKRRIMKMRQNIQPSDAAPPEEPASTAVAPPAPPKMTKDGKPIIHLGMERGNRIVVKWPESFETLTHELDFDVSGILGRIEHLESQGMMKKLIPCNFINASDVVQYMRAYKATGVVRFKASDEFLNWFADEQEALALSEEAHKLLDYDHDTIQTEFEGLKVPLYPWQSAGTLFINEVTRQGRGVLLCDATGLGKTFQAGAHLKMMGYQAMVVCPSHLKRGWDRKLKMLTNLTTFIVGDVEPGVTCKYPSKAHEADVIIISYTMLKRWAYFPLTTIMEEQNRVLIMDEAHLARNYDTKRTHYCQVVAERARHTIAVTATPLVNRVRELHPLLSVTRRKWTEASLKDFVKMYETPEGEPQVAEHLKGFMVRRLVNDVWKEAPKAEIGHTWLKLSNQDDYDAVEKDFIKWLVTRGASEDELSRAERGHALVKLNKLRQLAAIGKVDAATPIIQKTLDLGEQVVVFCAFNDPLKMLHRRTRNSALLIGGMPEKKKDNIIERFQAGKIKLLCVGIKAGGLGIDLPAACIGYFLDLPWTPADFEQGQGRLLRLGQERDCQFIKLLSKGTIDAKMEGIMERKAGSFSRAIGDVDALSRVISTDAENLTRTAVVAAVISLYMQDQRKYNLVDLFDAR